MTDFVYREPVKIIRDIIKHEMDLTDQQILPSNQKFKINSNMLFLYISYVGPSKIINRSSELVDVAGGGVAELSSVKMLFQIQIDILSYNDPEGGNPARQRKEEIAMAMGSIYAQQIQEQYNVQISKNLAPFVDTSYLEETAMMTRYTTTIMLETVLQKQKITEEYYSDFSKAVPPLLTVNA